VVSEPENRIWPWLLAAGLLVAAALRAAGLGTELWMDELLSLRSVQALSSPLQVFTEVHRDNNHYLNSLWMWTVGSGAPGWLLRLPPLLFGVALVGLAYRIERSGGRLPAIVAALIALTLNVGAFYGEAFRSGIQDLWRKRSFILCATRIFAGPADVPTGHLLKKSRITIKKWKKYMYCTKIW